MVSRAAFLVISRNSYFVSNHNHFFRTSIFLFSCVTVPDMFHLIISPCLICDPSGFLMSPSLRPHNLCQGEKNQDGTDADTWTYRFNEKTTHIVHKRPVLHGEPK